MPVSNLPIPALSSSYQGLVDNASTVVEAITSIAPSAVAEVMCTGGGLLSLGAGPLGQFQSPGTANRTLSDIGGILQVACENPPAVPGPAPPPFEGGQCDDALYLVTLQRTFNGEPTSTFNVSSWGPVSPVRVVENEFGNNRTIFDQRTSEGGPTVEVTVGQSDNVNERGGFVVQVARNDGLPDDCGSPAPVVPPRPPIVQPPSSPQIPTTNPDGSPGAPIVFAPRVGPIYIDADATLKVPVVVNITGGDITSEVTIPVSVSLPDFNVKFEYGGTGGGTGPGGEGGEPTPPQPICCDPPQPRLEEGEEEDPEEEPPEPEENSRIVGVIVDSEPGPGQSRATELGNPVPSLLVPRIATVQFEISVGGQRAYSSDYPVKTLRQYVAGPTEGKILRAFVGWEGGWQGSFSNVVEATNPTSEGQE